MLVNFLSAVDTSNRGGKALQNVLRRYFTAESFSLVSEIKDIEFERFKRPFCLVYDRNQLIHQVSVHAATEIVKNGRLCEVMN